MVEGCQRVCLPKHRSIPGILNHGGDEENEGQSQKYDGEGDPSPTDVDMTTDSG